MLLYLLCLLPLSLGIKAPKSDLKYSFVRDKKRDHSSDNPVYLMLPPEKSDNTISLKGVNVVNNNNLDEVLTSLKDQVFKGRATMINFKPNVALEEKNTVSDNKVGVSLLKLSEMMLLSDRVILPIDYLELVKTGCFGMERLKLLGLVNIAINLQNHYTPKFHFVIYNYRPIEKMCLNRYEKEFVNRQKNEINDILNEFMSSFGSNSPYFSPNNMNLRVDFVDKYRDIGALLRNLYNEDEKYYHTCYSDLRDEYRGKLAVCEGIEKLAKSLLEVKQTKFNFEEFKRIISHSRLYSQLLELNKFSYKRFNERMKELANQELNINNVKKTIDNLVNEVLSEYDNLVKKTSEDFEKNKTTQQIFSDMRNRLVKKIQSYLSTFNQELLINVMFNKIQNHDGDIKKLMATPQLDEDLSNLISKYDNEYCKDVKKVKYNILEGNKLYDGITKTIRFDLIQNLKDYSNRIMENMIRSGNYYHKFSIIDGIRFIPNQKIIDMFRKIISKINVPLNIRVTYLSPNAFGFSNLFKRNGAIGPNTRWYFTGKENKK